MKRGIFMGCFNPPHKRHLQVALEIIKSQTVDKVMFIPTSNWYHKQALIDGGHRLNMLKILIDDRPYLEVSDIEIKKNTQNYAYQTLDAIKKKHPNDEIYLIVGSDNLKTIDTWMKYDYLLSHYKVIAIKRDNDDVEQIINSNEKLKTYKENIIVFDKIDSSDLSSTFIRQLISDNKAITDYIDPKIYKYIRDNSLYK